MICNPDLHHKFVLLFEIKNASPLDLSFLSSPHQLAQDVRYGLVFDEAIKKALNLYFEKESLPVLRKWPAIEQAYATKGAKALCAGFYNLRMFGLVHPAGHTLIPGPVRFSLARSVDPIFPLTSGRNAAYGLYRMHGYYTPTAGKENGVSASDLEQLWKGLSSVFAPDTSSWPIETSMRGLWVFTHQAKRAEPIPSRELFNLVQTPALKSQAQKFEDYSIQAPPPGRLEAMPSVFLTQFA